MDLRKHYKLYKSGKQWCVMALATLASIIGVATAVSADTTVTNPGEINGSTQINVINNVDSSSTLNSDQAEQAQTAQSNEVVLNSAQDSTAAQSAEPASASAASEEKTTAAQSSATTVTAAQNSNSTEMSNDVANATTQVKVAAASSQKNGWVNENNHWTYYQNGQVQSGRSYSYLPTITANGTGAGHNWYLVDNGVVQSGVQKWAGTYYDFDPTTYLRVDNNYVKSQWGDWYMFGQDGRILSGLQKWAGSYYYFDPSTYLKVTNKNFTFAGMALHADASGIITGQNRNSSFMLSIYQAALDGWHQYGVLPSVTAAQAILESAWGESALATEGHNLFGIKGSYNGQSIVMRTAEYGAGGYYYINDAFRRYPSNYESVVDHGRFLASNSRYHNLLWQKNYAVVTNDLHADGYATAPTYASSLNNVIRTYGLDAWDRQVF